MTIVQLQEFQDCNVSLRLTDGEVLNATIRHVDLEYEDIVVDVLSTNRPARYKGPKESAYAINAVDIVAIEKLAAAGRSE